jgi:hypothetical protein
VSAAPDGGPLAGRWAVVTGASRGIGAEVARRLLADGARVALVARSRDALATLAQELDAEPIVCDVADPEQVERAAERVGVLAEVHRTSSSTTPASSRSRRHTRRRRPLSSKLSRWNLVAPFALVRRVPSGDARAVERHIVNARVGRGSQHLSGQRRVLGRASTGLRALHEVLRCGAARPRRAYDARVAGAGRHGVVGTRSIPTTAPASRPRADADVRRRPPTPFAGVVLAPSAVNVDELRLSAQLTDGVHRARRRAALPAGGTEESWLVLAMSRIEARHIRGDARLSRVSRRVSDHEGIVDLRSTPRASPARVDARPTRLTVPRITSRRC